jgi:hypothetical protein
MPTLADIYSAIDSAKRRGADVVRNPGASLQQMIGYGVDRANAARDQLYQATEEEGIGYGPKTQALAKKMAEVYNPIGMTVSYRGSHLAPGPDFGAPLYDLTGGGQMYPADVYSASAARIYGTGYPKADREAFDLARRIRGNPDAEITMYRAVPKDEKITNINKGDWVTLSKDYAKTHGESVLDKNYKILSKKVKAKELYTNADSIHEFGYHPNE